MIVGKLKEPLVMDVGEKEDIYICRGVYVEVQPCRLQPNALSKSAVREVMQKIRRNSEYEELLEGE